MHRQVIKIATMAALAISSAAGAATDATTYVPGYRSNYAITRQANGTVAVQRLRDGGVQATLESAGPIRFQDVAVFFDEVGVPGQAYRLYQAAFNRTPDAAGLGYWIEIMQGGVSLVDVANSFYNSAEFQSTYGQVTDSQFLTLLYRNVLQRTPDQAGFDYWLKVLATGVPRAVVLRDFSESQENRTNVAAVIQAGVTYVPYNGSSYEVPLQSYRPPATASAPSTRLVNATAADLLGTYKRLPVENGYHEGKLVQTVGGLAWQNGMGQSWTLKEDLANGRLLTDTSSPYHGSDHPDITVVFVKGKVVGIRVVGEFFARDGVALPSGTTPMESVIEEQVGVSGFMYHEIADAPAGYGYGFSAYMAMYPMVDRTMQKHQTGIGYFVSPDNSSYQQALLPPENAMRAGNPNAGPTWAAYFQTIEGGQGNWGDTQFPTVDPKFWVIGTPDGYAHGLNSPGWAFGSRAAASRDLMSIAQLSNRILTPPDGFTFRSGTNGEFFGYGWMALPLTDKRSATVPVGDQSWTLFFNATNFHGPVVFWVPDAYTRLSKTWSPAAGRGLDAQPAKVAGTALELNMTAAFTNADLRGDKYGRNARLLFPVDDNNVSWLSADRAHYASGALFEPVRKWFAGGTAASGTFDRGATWYAPYTMAGLDVYFDGKKIAGLDNYVTASVLATPGAGAAFGLKWQAAATPGVFPEYFKQTGDTYTPVSASEVPPETLLTLSDFAAPSRGETYTSPDSGSDSWMTPSPAAGPYSAQLSDGSVVTYYWYKFIDQPSLQSLGWSAQEKAQLQARVELLHRNWAGTREFLAPPSAGVLATLDAALLVTPPAGLEAGYVPVVTRQEAGR